MLATIANRNEIILVNNKLTIAGWIFSFFENEARFPEVLAIYKRNVRPVAISLQIDLSIHHHRRRALHK